MEVTARPRVDEPGDEDAGDVEGEEPPERQLGPALDEAFASKVPACVNVKIAGSDFRKDAISV